VPLWHFYNAGTVYKCPDLLILLDFLTLKRPGSFTALAFAPDDLTHDLTDLEMTWLP